MKTALKSQIMPVMLILLGWSLSGCLWMMVPVMGAHAGQTKAKEETGWTFWKKLEVADTPQKHRAIAKAYRQDADDYRLEAEEHRRRKTAYEGYRSKSWGDKATVEFMVIHCQRLVGKFTELADEMEDLARQHELLAKKVAAEQKKGAE